MPAAGIVGGGSARIRLIACALCGPRPSIVVDSAVTARPPPIPCMPDDQPAPIPTTTSLEARGVTAGSADAVEVRLRNSERAPDCLAIKASLSLCETGHREK